MYSDKKEDHTDPEDYYISSIDLAQQPKDEEIKNKKETQFSLIRFLLSFIVFFIHNLFNIFVITLICTVSSLVPCFSQNVKLYFHVVFYFLCYVSILWNIYCIFFVSDQDKNLLLFQQDGVFFYFTSLIVFTYLKTCQRQIQSIRDVLNPFDSRSLSGAIYGNGEGYKLDYEKNTIAFPSSSIAHTFKLFTSPVKTEDKDLKPASEMVYMFRYVEFKEWYAIILLGIEFIKTLFAFFYLYKHDYSYSFTFGISLISVFLIFIITTYTIVENLGNNDLQRKYFANRQLNKYVDFSNIKETLLETKIDVTDPISMETWDNMRKQVLSHESDQIYKYELCYFCLFFYYIFSVIVCLSEYFELYWILPQESELLYPLSAIMNTFTFIFLSFFLLFRFYEGSKLNDSFGEFETNIDFLLDTFEDLQTMYSDLFLKQINPKRYKIQHLKESPHSFIINRIKMTSNLYIKECIKFEGKVYNENEKDILRQNLINSIKTGMLKIKRSIQTDSRERKYKFLNSLEVDFASILTTILVAVISSLPNVAPKFIGFYKS